MACCPQSGWAFISNPFCSGKSTCHRRLRFAPWQSRDTCRSSVGPACTSAVAPSIGRQQRDPFRSKAGQIAAAGVGLPAVVLPQDPPVVLLQSPGDLVQRIPDEGLVFRRGQRTVVVPPERDHVGGVLVHRRIAVIGLPVERMRAAHTKPGTGLAVPMIFMPPNNRRAHRFQVRDRAPRRRPPASP